MSWVLLYAFLLFPSFCSRESHPELYAQRVTEAEDLFMFARGCSEAPRSPLFQCVSCNSHTHEIKDSKQDLNQIKSNQISNIYQVGEQIDTAIPCMYMS